MADQESQLKTFPLKYRGVVTKLDPTLMTDGQVQQALNVVSVQEGNVTVRTGRKFLGQLPAGATNPLKVVKLPIPNQPVPISNAPNVASPTVITTSTPYGWLTGFVVNIRGATGNTAVNGSWVITRLTSTTFSILVAGNGAYVNGGEVSLTNGDAGIRYVGEKNIIYRTTDNYASYTVVSPTDGVDGSRDIFPNRWSMAPYSAGATANPYAYFACPGVMLKDQGNNPFTPLRAWGITPALAAASAVNAAGSFVVVTNATLATPIQITAVAHGFTTGQKVAIADVVGNTAANGSWTTTRVDADNFTLNNSVGVDPYTSGGTAILLAPDSFQPGASPYDYVYTFRDPATNNEGNPSAFMDESLAVSSQNGHITITVWGSPDPQITGAQSIAIYRRGGSYADGIFRQIGFVTNPGVVAGLPSSTTFVDTVPDIGLIFAAQAEFDNYPPVVSTLRYPINATISAISPGTPGWNTVTLSLPVTNIVTVGTSVTVGSSSGGTTSTQETAFIAAQPYTSTAANTTILLYLQLKHSTSEPVLIGAVTGQPCSLAISAFDSLFLAGDENNPHVLYKSKSGRPEAFPIIDSLGNSGSINVGTPSNGIQNLCEFRSKIVCLNVSNVFEVDVFTGVMYGPVVTPAQRGLLVRWAFCKGDNAVFYLAYDGIYAWDGGVSKKVSEAIDPIFHPSAPAGLYPSMDMSQDGLRFCRMEYYRSQVFFSYLDTAGLFWFWRYEPTYDRWTQERHIGVGTTGNPFFFDFYTEPDTSVLIFARTDAAGGVISQDDKSEVGAVAPVEFSDEFTAGSPLSGVAIPYSFQSQWFVPGDFVKVKLFLDLILEYTSPRVNTSSPIFPVGLETFTVNVYYDYSTTADPVDVFTINPITPNRTLAPLPLQVSGTPGISAGKEAFAVSVKISGTTKSLITFHSLGMRILDRDNVQLGITSDWLNLGTNNDKRLYQLHLEHNTGGINVTMHMDIRYGIAGTLQANDVATFPINSTEKTTVTLPIPEAGFPSSLPICKSVRLRPAFTGASTINISAVVFTGTNKIYTYTVVSGSIPVAGNVITITGLDDPLNNGVGPIIAVSSTTITAGGALGSSATLQNGTGISSSLQNLFRIFYQPTFDKEDLPPDSVLFTPWVDFGYSCEKIARNLLLDIDTGGVAASIAVQADGATLQTFSVTSTANDRKRTIPFASSPVQPIGKMWRLASTPGTNGKAQIFAWIIDYIKEPCEVNFWDSYEQAFSYDGYKFLKQIWIEYACSVPVTLAILTDNAAAFFSVTLPAHTNRDIARFYLPDAVAGVINKSKIYRFKLTSTTSAGFKFYLDGSGIEFAALGTDQRGAYSQMKFSEAMKIPAEPTPLSSLFGGQGA